MFWIDPMSRVPIYEQLIAQVERFVLAGALKAGDAMPSVRALSAQLSVNPNTIQKAYGEMCQRGLLCAVPGKGCFVAPTAEETLKNRAKEQLEQFQEQVRRWKAAGLTKDELYTVIDTVFEEQEGL